MNRIGVDALDIVMRFLDLPTTVKASRVSQQWHCAHGRRRGAVIGAKNVTRNQ